MSTPPLRTDRDLSEDLRQQFSQLMTRNRPYAQFSNTLWLFLLQAISFSVKVFIRTKIGRLTFGFWTIIAAYFWVRYFMGGDVDFLRNGVTKIYDYTQIFDAKIQAAITGIPQITPKAKIDTSYLAYFLGFLIMVFEQIGVLFHHGLQLRPPEYLVYQPIYIFSYLVLLKGLYVWWQSAHGYLNREDLDPLDRGESLLFGSLKGKSVGKVKINRGIILMWLDPIFVILTGFLVWLGNGNFGIFFMISGLVLFFEERAVRIRDQKAVLTKLASDKWTERILAEYKEFKEGRIKGSGGPFGQVAFGNEADVETKDIVEEETKGESSKGKAGF